MTAGHGEPSWADESGAPGSPPSTGELSAELRGAARAWLDQDPDPQTRAELTRLLDAGVAGDQAAAADLAERFSSRLAFGTAGLRGELGAGPMRMNRVLVAQAAAGFAAFLLEREDAPSAVIGYDARHNSRVFAIDSAEILAGAGVRVTLLPRALPTPVLAFGIRHLGVSAGIMVTASHNPARDNGYKVYLGGADDGSQIVSPSDERIEGLIALAARASIAELPRSGGYATADESLVDAYVAETVAVASSNERRSFPFAYTPLHGVGLEVAERVFSAAGFDGMTVAVAQAEPDPDFPTVSFPNPEEPGAMDLVFETAAASGAELVIANDPDADRVAVGIPTPAGWRRLSGNEVGWILGWRAARALAGSPTDAADGIRPTLAASLVSSPALGAIAEHHGLGGAETLTGFKWISRAPGLAFGYEEALGYLVDPGKVRDKDGISAALAVLDLHAELRATGRTLADHLLEFAETIGGYASEQVSIRVAQLSEIPATMARLRAEPPREIAGLPVQSIDDFREGFGGFPPSELLRYRLPDGRVIVRPSGTEPKLKAYIDAWTTDGDGAERLAAASELVARLEQGVRELLL